MLTVDTWEPLLKSIPKGARGISYSQRGFKGSTALTDDEAACTVECPRHGSLFDLRTGKPKTLPAYVPVDTFPVIIDDNMIKLEVE